MAEEAQDARPPFEVTVDTLLNIPLKDRPQAYVAIKSSGLYTDEEIERIKGMVKEATPQGITVSLLGIGLGIAALWFIWGKKK